MRVTKNWKILKYEKYRLFPVAKQSFLNDGSFAKNNDNIRDVNRVNPISRLVNIIEI